MRCVISFIMNCISMGGFCSLYWSGLLGFFVTTASSSLDLNDC